MPPIVHATGSVHNLGVDGASTQNAPTTGRTVVSVGPNALSVTTVPVAPTHVPSALAVDASKVFMWHLDGASKHVIFKIDGTQVQELVDGAVPLSSNVVAELKPLVVTVKGTEFDESDRPLTLTTDSFMSERSSPQGSPVAKKIPSGVILGRK